MNKKKSGQLALKGGAYSFALTAIVLAILIAVNVFVSALPAPWIKYDISAAKLYSVTGNTQAVVNNLEQEVTIYWVVQAGEEDNILQNLLDKYGSLSERLKVVKRNPDVYPTFAQQYTSEEVENNSLVVECGDRFRYIPAKDLYEEQLNTQTEQYETVGFDGESAITSAIDYVVTEDLPIMYLLEGHGEAELPSGLAAAIERENIQTRQLNIRLEGGIPEDADIVMLYAPQSDISQEEQTILDDYATNGGKLLVLAGPVEGDDLSNITDLVWVYGVTMEPGLVIEGSRGYYAFGYPYNLMPEMVSHPITDALIEENYRPILPIAQGMSISGSSSVNVLLASSKTSFTKPEGFALESYIWEPGNPEGPFTLAISVETDGAGEIVFFGCSSFVEDAFNDYSSGANVDLVMNSISYMIGERENLSIRSKSMDYRYLTISEDAATVLQLLMIVVFPMTYLLIGLAVILIKRRQKKHETV